MLADNNGDNRKLLMIFDRMPYKNYQMTFSLIRRGPLG